VQKIKIIEVKYLQDFILDKRYILKGKMKEGILRGKRKIRVVIIYMTGPCQDLIAVQNSSFKLQVDKKNSSFEPSKI